jgi:hypothetical protein
MGGLMPHRSHAWIWAGRVVAALAVIGLARYLDPVGLDRADKLASALGALLVLAAFLAPYLLPPRQLPPAVLRRRALAVTAPSSSPTAAAWPRRRSTT